MFFAVFCDDSCFWVRLGFCFVFSKGVTGFTSFHWFMMFCRVLLYFICVFFFFERVFASRF